MDRSRLSILRRLRSVCRESSVREYRCDICGVDGHSAKVCMFASGAERSASGTAAMTVIKTGRPIGHVAKEFRLSVPSVHNAIRRVQSARVATLRAMTQILVDDIYAIDSIRAPKLEYRCSES